MTRSYRKRDLIDRLLSRVVVDGAGHWIWMGARDAQGYGRCGNPGGTTLVHRAIYIVLKGPIPDDLPLDHLCRVPPCCNPEHLEPVTQAENLRRGAWSNKTTCAKGHAYTPENTGWRWRNRPAKYYRYCRACAGCPPRGRGRYSREYARIEGRST